MSRYMILIMSYMSNSSEVQTIKSLASANHQVPRLLPWWHFTSLKQCNIILPLNPNPLPIIGRTSLELKPYSPYMKRTSTKPSLAQVSKGAPHMLNHTTPSALFTQKNRGVHTWSFPIWLLSVQFTKTGFLNHHK